MPFTASDEQFARLLGRRPSSFDPDAERIYDASSTLEDIRDTFIGRMILKKVSKRPGFAEDDTDAATKKMFDAMIMSMPLRALMTMGGTMDLDQVDGIVDMANGHYLRGIRKLLKK